MGITRRRAFRKKYPSAKDKGSQLWLQLLVGVPDNRWLLDAELAKHIDDLGPGAIDWVSPLPPTFEEFHDAAFVNQLGLGAHVAQDLKTFWPASGPRWDALATTGGGKKILVEAKAHIAEIASQGCTATAPKSIALIEASLAAVKGDLKVDPKADWMGPLYQHANRLAHLWWLRDQGVDAELVFLYFLNADGVGGPSSAERWRGAIELEEKVLDVRRQHSLRKHVHHVFFDVERLKP